MAVNYVKIDRVDSLAPDFQIVVENLWNFEYVVIK